MELNVKNPISAILLVALWSTAMAAAADLEVDRLPFGSGTPSVGETDTTQAAEHVADGLYHVPNYLPGHPTAATIWPREITLKCARERGTERRFCSGYSVVPTVGRGEYIFVRPEDAPEPPASVMIIEPSAPAPLPRVTKKPLG
ncbi:MAG TPA: hypothetical protein VF427_10840 [Noviherbaspirillum sp.]